MHNLRNLSHLDLAGTNIKEIPVHVIKLKRLQTLTLFSVGRQRGTGIGELRQLNDLHGKLSILELQNVNGREDALEARLKEKNQLEGLWLEWSINSGDSRKEREVLEKLQPHTNLKELTIKNYGGTAFPFWLVERSSLSNIVCLCLSNCKYCISLPPLGQLHSLKDLSITGFYAVETIGPEFYGSDGLATKPFESLQTLRFKEMVEWEEWFPFENDIEGRAFPCLQELYVENCPKLTKHLPSNLPCLTKLVVSDCQELVASLPRAPDILHLQLGYCDKFLLKNLPPQLKMISFEGWSLSERIEEVDASLKILNIYDCLSLSWLPMDRLSTTLEVLEIKSSDNLKFPVHLYYDSLEKLLIESSCCSLQNFPLDIFPKLKHLTIKNCTSMESISVPCRPQYDLQSLRHLHIFGCPKFVSFPEGGLHAPNLSYFRIDLCKHLKSLPQRMHTHIPSLEVLTISSCPEIVSFPKGGLPSNLRSLCIYGCARLYANRAEWHLQRLTCLGDFCISCEDIKSLPEEGLLPTTLATLRLAGCPHLKSLNRKGLNELTNLEILLIDDCPELECLPEEGLPEYLSHFRIQNVHC
ncbi:putative disease resistance protein At3g14460 isoform X2 [Hevea brasiliensis]|nr:putative disease resistance protein At3g14460 isoform X2 [Hevea brasiliensis]